jgi:hypothetical protein
MINILRYDTPTEVSKKAYDILVSDFSGIICHKVIDGKYYIKIWLMRYVKDVKKVINENLN